MDSAWTDEKTRKQQEKKVTALIEGTIELRSKRELLEKFIAENLPQIPQTDDVYDEFNQFINQERLEAFQRLVEDEKLKPAELQAVIANYLYTEREPLGDEIVNTLEEKPKILERRTKVARVLARIKDYVSTFIDGVAE